MTLLMYCFKFNFLDYADKQIENLKNPYQKDSSGYTVLDYSIKHDVKFFKKIINKFEYIKFDQSKKWPHKFLCVALDNFDILKEILKIDKEININNYLKHSLLNYSIMFKRKEISFYLLDNGANFLSKDYRGWNSFFYSSYYKEFDTFDKIKNLCSSQEFNKLSAETDVFSKSFNFYKKQED